MSNNQQLRHITFNETFDSSLAEHNAEKFTLDKSLVQGIKSNDVGKIIDQGQDGGLEDRKELYNELEEIEALVLETRKKYDEMRTVSMQKEKEIENLKKKNDFLTQESQKYSQIIDKQRTDLESTTHQFQKVCFTLDATVYQKDIYLNMKDVLKRDNLILKKRYFDKDVELMRDHTKLKSIRTEHANKTKLGRRCREMLESMEKIVEEKQYERTTKINSFCDVLTRKQMNQFNKETRSREIEEAMNAAMTDKLKEEREWAKILSTNLFLKAILKSKMEKLMLQYNHVEVAFHKMKQATSVKTANDFIERFLIREETYGALLQSITEKEEKLEEVKEERDILSKNYSRTWEVSEQLIEDEKKHDLGPQKNYKSILEELNQELLTIQRQKQMIYEWAVKFLTAYKGHKARDQITRHYNRSQIKELFFQVLSVLNSFFKDLSQEQNSNQTIDQVYYKAATEKILTQEMSDRNTRIKTQSTYDKPTYDTDDKDAAYDDLSEIDYLQHNRRAVKKNDMQNRRFRIKTKPY